MMRQAAFAALMECDPVRKVALTNAAWLIEHRPEDGLEHGVTLMPKAGRKPLVDAAPSLVVTAPGRPVKPDLLHPASMPRRRLGSAAGRAALIHAITHIEFNAINLALDAVCRFANQPDDYYLDWIKVAKEEAYHFTLLSTHLQEHYGHVYGDFPAHNGLWDMAEKTRDDVLVRMALVPRILEARGLDVTPGMRERLAHHGDHAAAAILDIILSDEIGHVAVGNRWYERLCGQRGLEPMSTFTRLMQDYGAMKIHPPLNRVARLAGGFTAAELDAFELAAAAPATAPAAALPPAQPVPA